MKFQLDRSRRSGHAHSLNIQDYGPTRQSEPERSRSNLRHWWKCRPVLQAESLPPNVNAALSALEAAVKEMQA